MQTYRLNTEHGHVGDFTADEIVGMLLTSGTTFTMHGVVYEVEVAEVY